MRKDSVHTETLGHVVKRLERLETQNRRLKHALSLAVLVGVGCVAFGAAAPNDPVKTVEAERFVIRDSQGKIHARFGLLPAGTGFALFDDNGKARAGLLLDEDGPTLDFRDTKGNARATLGADASTTQLSLHDVDGVDKLLLSVNTDHDPYVILKNRQHKINAALGAVEDEAALLFFDEAEQQRHFIGIHGGEPLITMKDDNQKLRVLLQSSDEVTKMALLDVEGKERALMQVNSENVPAIALKDATGKPRVALAAPEQSTEFTLYDRQARPRLAMAVNDAEDPLLVFKDSEGRLNAVLGSAENETALLIYDGEGRQRQFVGVSNDVPLILQRGADEKLRNSLIASQDETEFTLYDPEGHARTVIACDKENDPSITLKDAEGNSRLLLFHDAAGSAVSLLDAGGELRARLGGVSGAASNVVLGDPGGTPRVVLTVDQPGGGLLIKGNEGRVLGSLTAGEAGTGLILYDASGNKVFTTPVSPNGEKKE